jgi:hypothetical protein
LGRDEARVYIWLGSAPAACERAPDSSLKRDQWNSISSHLMIGEPLRQIEIENDSETYMVFVTCRDRRIDEQKDRVSRRKVEEL